MSIVMNMSLLLEEPNINIRKKILNFFEERISNLDKLSETEVSVSFKNDIYFDLDFEGKHHWEIWDNCHEEFEANFVSNYFLISHIEGDGIYIDLRLDEIKESGLKISPGRYKKQYYDIVESDYYLLMARNWAIKKINKKYDKNYELVNISEYSDNRLVITENIEKEIVSIIKADNSNDFRRLLEKGLDLNHLFESFNLAEDVINETIAASIILLNAKKIAKITFTKECIENLIFFKYPAYIAAENNLIDMLYIIINCGFNLNKKSYGDTPLLVAMYKGHYEICRILIKSGKYNVNLKNNHDQLGKDEKGEFIHYCQIPICEAVRQNRVDIIELLINQKLKKEHVNEAIKIAIKNDNQEIVKLLSDRFNLKV